MTKQKINTDSSQKYTHYVRTKCNTFTITEDKLKLRLKDFKKSLENKNSIFCYGGMIITIFIALITSSFNDFILSKEIWKAIFVVSLFLMVILFFKGLIFFIQNKKSIEEVINDLKQK